MSANRIETRHNTIAVEPLHARQTERPKSPFREALAGGVNVLMTGAEAASSLVGGQILAAGVHQARGEVVGRIAGPAGAGSGRAGGVAGLGGGATEPSSEIASMFEMQRESQAMNLQLLALQEEIQDENRRFSTLTNVLRAKHDTAKAAVSNIRS